jgi:hypothetical protein
MPTFDTPAPITATIDLVVGDVRISAGDRDATLVDVRPSDPSDADDRKAAEQTLVEYANGQLLVRGPRQRSWRISGGAPSIDVAVELPAGSGLHGSAQWADFRSDGSLGECRIKTGLGRILLDRAGTLNLRSGSGDIRVEHATGGVEVTTGSGDVQLRELDHGAVVKNSNGATWIGEARGDLQLKAANGSIAVEVAHAGVNARSANGKVRVGEVVRGSVTVETRIGDLEVGIREGTAAWLDVRTVTGKVHNDLEVADGPEPSADTVEVAARTTVGDILIRRP